MATKGTTLLKMIAFRIKEYETKLTHLHIAHAFAH